MKGHQTVSLPVALTSAVVGAFLVGLVTGEVSRPATEPEESFAAAATSTARPVAPAPHEAAGAAQADAPPPHPAPIEPRIPPFVVPRLPVRPQLPVPVPPPAPAAAAPAQPAPGKESPLDRLAVVHTLPVRIDLRSGDELERELLLVPELDLDSEPTPYLADQLFTTARANQRAGQPPPSIVMACKLRPDLAGLPFRVGVEAVLPAARAKEMHNRSRYLRGTYQSLITPRSEVPTPVQLFSVLTDERGNWAREESVPCIQQILLAEDQPTRRMGCEMLGELRTGEATAALVRMALFDTEPANRAAAVDELRGRGEAEIVPLVIPYLRYPWAHAVEHACEALINLKATTAVPALAVAYDLPDPDVPFRIGLLDEVGGSFRRELVRVNHARNCVMCHTPSSRRTDLLRAQSPVAAFPLPPRMTTSYYGLQNATMAKARNSYVTAKTTYLSQDFSLDQPVANPGRWPARQRYDYFLRYSPGAGGPTLRKPEESPYRKAIGLAIRHLSGRDPDGDKDWLNEQKTKAPVIEDVAGAIARVMLLTSYPDALLAVTHPDVADKLMKGKPKEVEDAVEWLQKAHGTTAARLALIAYLDPLTRSAEEAVATRAGRLLTIARGPFNDSGLAKAMKDALGD